MSTQNTLTEQKISTSQIQNKIESKTKPIGALGDLESLALQICKVQNTLSPSLKNPSIAVFAADHGIAKSGVSPYPQEVTFQMVMNFLAGGAAINVLSKANGISLKIINAGVNFDFEEYEALLNIPVGKGTKNFLFEPAMSQQELSEALQKGKNVVNDLYKNGCNCIGFGEMGIANTSSAAVLMHLFTGHILKDCVGRGTGLDDKGLENKVNILNEAVSKHQVEIWEEIMFTFSGFEIAMICGAVLQATEQNMLIMVDGFIATAAVLAAVKKNPNVIDNCIFCHQSDEKGHKLMLEYLNAKPILNLGMRLGEGTGAAVAYPIIKSAVTFFNEMASFESAGVSEKS